MMHRALLAFLFVTSSVCAAEGRAEAPACAKRDASVDGPFTIARESSAWDGYKILGLSIDYRGYLLDTHAPYEIHFYVRVNGREAFVRADQNGSGGARFGTFVDEASAFSLDGVTPALLAAAFDDDGALAPWDIEVAAFVPRGEFGDAWDSNFSNNYRARLAAPDTCW